MANGRYSDKILRSKIFYLRDYQPYWSVFKLLRNPKRDDITLKVLDLKNENHPKHQKAVAFFSGLLENFLAKAIDEEEEVYAAYVPSHEAHKESPGLAAILKVAKKKYNIVNSKNLLVRHKTVEKLSGGGNRDREVHLNSIKVVKKSFPKGAKILLIDDVTTSHNSLLACEDLLHERKADLVITVALTHTVSDDQ